LVVTCAVLQVSLASKMAEDVAAVDTLSEMLREKAFPAAQKELAELKAYAGASIHFLA
jgi:oligopeptidase A